MSDPYWMHFWLTSPILGVYYTYVHREEPWIVQWHLRLVTTLGSILAGIGIDGLLSVSNAQDGNDWITGQFICFIIEGIFIALPTHLLLSINDFKVAMEVSCKCCYSIVNVCCNCILCITASTILFIGLVLFIAGIADYDANQNLMNGWTTGAWLVYALTKLFVYNFFLQTWIIGFFFWNFCCLSQRGRDRTPSGWCFGCIGGEEYKRFVYDSVGKTWSEAGFELTFDDPVQFIRNTHLVQEQGSHYPDFGAEPVVVPIQSPGQVGTVL